jgi:hypothetical protein
MSAPDESAKSIELKLDIRVACMGFYVTEEASEARLEEWRSFVNGERDYITFGDYRDPDGASTRDISVNNGEATITYTECRDQDFNLFAEVPASLLRAEIRRQLPD